MPFHEGQSVLLVDRSGRRRLVRLRAGARFHSNKGTVEHDHLLTSESGALIRTSTGAPFTVWQPRLSDYVLEMTRHSGIIYPKDAGVILLWADIAPGMTVLEAGLGSGALTLYLLRAVGISGRVISYERREDFIELGLNNIRGFMGEPQALTVRQRDVTEPIVDSGLDRVILDVPEPWRALPGAIEALVPGGIFLAYNPSIVQVQQTVEAITQSGWFEAPEVLETFYRPWKVDGAAVRPEQTMVGHTGFLTLARRLAQPWARGRRQAQGECEDGSAVAPHVGEFDPGTNSASPFTSGEDLVNEEEMAARSDPPDAGVGGEGEPFDLSVLAPVTDREIERGVQTAFRLAGDLDARNIQVIAEGGTVTISGRVPSDLDRARAEELAFVVHGVRRVRNALSF